MGEACVLTGRQRKEQRDLGPDSTGLCHDVGSQDTLCEPRHWLGCTLPHTLGGMIMSTRFSQPRPAPLSKLLSSLGFNFLV